MDESLSRSAAVSTEATDAARTPVDDGTVDTGLEDMAQRLLESVQDYAIFMMNTEGFVTSWNLGAQRIKGYEAHEAIGRHFSMFYLPEAIDRGWPAEELRRATLIGKYEDEGWRIRKDGSRIWANVVITAVRDERGTLLGFSKVTRDLTERRRHEEELREREESLRLLVEGVRDHAMFLLDPAGCIRTWNEGARVVLGFAADDVLGRDASVLLSLEEKLAGKWAAEFASARCAGFFMTKGWRHRADGSRVWAESSTTELKDGAGAIRGYVQIVRDLSEQRRVEALEVEGRHIEEFIAMLSHELRNPLAPIENAVSILRRFVSQPEAVWCVELIGRQVTHMTRLVDDLLDVSRINNGKIRLTVEDIDLNDLVKSSVESARSTVDACGHALTLELPGISPPVAGDPTRLTQALTNLLTNAAKYTPEGGTISVSVASMGTIATIQIVDDGIGMSDELLQRAFDPFVQGDRALDRSAGGLGIGLTLVKSIIEMHGGTVAVASAGIGKGAAFTLTLPLCNPRQTLEACARPAETSAAKPERILVVDDNRDAAESIAMLLRICGHDVQIAYDGLDALAMARNQSPSVILLDIGLPGIDGYEVARRLQRMGVLNKARLIAMTGYGSDKDRQATKEAGFDLHFTKPVGVEELIKALS